MTEKEKFFLKLGEKRKNGLVGILFLFCAPIVIFTTSLNKGEEKTIMRLNEIENVKREIEYLEVDNQFKVGDSNKNNEKIREHKEELQKYE